MVTCWPVVTEAAWLLRNRPASVRVLFRTFEDGVLRLARLDETDMPAIDGILKTYASLRAPSCRTQALVIWLNATRCSRSSLWPAAIFRFIGSPETGGCS